MKKQLFRLLALLLTLIFLLESGCSPRPQRFPSASSSESAETPDTPDVQEIPGSSETPNAPGPSESPSFDEAEHKKFSDFTNGLFLDTVSSDIITLHYTLAHPENYGITDYDVTLGSLNRETMDQRYKEIQTVLGKLKSFPYDKLSSDDRLTYDVLSEYLTVSLKEKDFPYYEDIFSPIMGLHGNLPIVLAEYTFRRETDIEDYLALLEQIPAYLDEAVFYEKTRAKKGFVMPDSAIDEVIDACLQFTASTKDNAMISTFDDRIDAFKGLSEAQKASYRERNSELVTSLIFPAYQNVIRCLKEIRGKGSNSQGLCYSPGGKEYYGWLIESLVGSGHTPEELLSLVQERLDVQLTKMYTILSASPELAEKISAPLQDPRSPAEMLGALQEKISDDYPALPADADYQIKYVHKSLEASASPAFYMIPPVDDLEENTIYINKSSTNNGTLFSTLAHEGYPGHLYQTVYTSATLTNPLRHVLDFSGYVEGWGLYVEHESYAMNDLLGDTSDSLASLASLNSSVTLAVYAMLDLNIHYNGWSMDQAAEYIETWFGTQDEAAITSMYHTIVSEPAYYLKYYVGYLEILLLREKAQARLEENFSLKEFHKFFLDIGPCPFPVIDKYMEKWMNGNF